VMRGMKITAALLGFFEVTIWLYAVSAVVADARDNAVNVFAYGAGFAAGTLAGMWIEQVLALGSQVIRVMNVDRETSATRLLRGRGFQVTEVQGSGPDGPVEICFLVVPRKKAPLVMEIV